MEVNIWLPDISLNLLSCGRLHFAMIVRHIDSAIHRFLVVLPLKCCDIIVRCLRLQWCIIKYLFYENLFNTYSMKQPDLYYFETIIKGSTELTHGSACNGVWKLQSMNVLKLLSTN